MVSNSNLAQNAVVPTTQIVINESPIKWCSVTLSDVISRGKRLEASVFDVESRQAIDTIRKGRYPAVDLIGKSAPVQKAHYGGRLKRNYVDKHSDGAVGFIGSSEMLDIKPVPVKFMVDDKRVVDLHVTSGTLLLSRSGTIGNVSFVNRSLEKLLISEHAMRLECDSFSGYVYAFLKTHTGQAVVKSNIYGAVIQQIEPEHLATVPIPDAPDELKKRIHDLIVASYELRDESNDLLDEAQVLLVEELQLPALRDFDVDYFRKQAPVDTYSVKLSDMAGRLDASYHVPVVGAITKHLQECAAEVTTIGDSRISNEVLLPGRFKRVYVDEGYGHVLFGGKQIHELDPSGKKYLSNSKHNERIVRELLISENTTLITRSGTIGKVALVPKHWENWVASEHIIRVVPANDDIAGYLNVFLSSEYGYQLITHFTYGSVVDEIDDNHVRQIPFPLLKNKAVQDRINALALEANKKRYEAYLLEQQAIEIMNNEVIFAK